MKELESKATVGARIVRGLQEFADSLKEPGPITEKFTCRVVQLDLRPTPYDPELVRATRLLLHTSQAVFARFLGVSVRTVQAWEQGTSTPNDMACRFMDEIRFNPKYWLERLQQAAVTK